MSVCEAAVDRLPSPILLCGDRDHCCRRLTDDPPLEDLQKRCIDYGSDQSVGGCFLGDVGKKMTDATPEGGALFVFTE